MQTANVEMLRYFVLSLNFCHVNVLPNDKFLDWSNLKAFANGKFDVTE